MRWNYSFTAFVLFTLSLFTSTAYADSFVYSVSNHFSSFQVDGTITTDTNAGILSISNILDFNLLLSAAGQTETLTFQNVSNSGIFGDALTATDTGLFFDYSTAMDSGFFLQNSDTNTYLCYQTAGCDAGADPHESTNLGGTPLMEAQTGNVQIGTMQSTAITPEPSTFALLATGMMGIITIARSRRVAH
ncbi:MAG: PEP-CTERM sorting domain-containing protein [Janthinobacterium lividum]